ncbi:MAG TPA: ATP synthase F0 subunit B [Clostridiales bacterium]|jgi:F-type H+-transporting ATPase subunit b|nr:ATP synthase F0 subunit B [Clostridiales bacterium]
MQIDLSTVVLTIINFGILMVVLNVLLFKPILKHMAERQARVDAGLQARAQSAQQLEQAQKALEEDEKLLRTRLHDEAEARLQEAADAARLHKETVEMDLRRRRDEALVEMNDEQQRMKQELSRELPKVIDKLGDRIGATPKVGA